MVRIRKMLVRVRQPLVPVPMHVAAGDVLRMNVLVMRVVHMLMLVLDRLVRVPMRVLLGEVQPDAGRHQRAAREQRPRDALA